MIGNVEDIDCHTNCCGTSSETWEVLAQAHVDVLIRKCAGDCEATAPERIVLLIGKAAEPVAPGVDIVFPAERGEARPLDPNR
jgi:hypothetical protein